MAKQNENQTGGGAHTDGGEAGVLSDDELLSHLGLSDELGQEGADAGEDEADGENGGDETDEEEQESEADGDEEVADDDEAEESAEEDEAADDDDESEEEAEESEESEEEEKLPRSVTKLQKRVRKLTQRAKSAEERVQTLEPEVARLQGELSEAKAPVIAPTEADPLADLRTEAAVNDRVQKAKMIRRWCLQNPEGGEVEGADGKMIEFTPAKVRERLMYAEDLIEAAPKRLALLQETAKYDAFAKTAYPALFQSGSQESKVIEDFIARCPEITRLPNWRLIVGDALLGGSVRLERTKQKPKEKTKVAPRVAVKPTAAKPAPAGRVNVTRKKAKFYESGSQEDLAAAIADGAI